MKLFWFRGRVLCVAGHTFSHLFKVFHKFLRLEAQTAHEIPLKIVPSVAAAGKVSKTQNDT